MDKKLSLVSMFIRSDFNEKSINDNIRWFWTSKCCSW